MAEVIQGLRTISAGSNPMSPTNSATWLERACPHCGGPRLLRVAQVVDGNGMSGDEATKWLRCPICREGSVVIHGAIHPAPKPLREPQGLPDVDARIWNEARTCMGVGANSAAVMLCRKLLFHVAVAHGLPAKDNKDRAPTFRAAVEHLEAEGIVTAKMRPWIDRIKDLGNDANHELTPITTDQALDVAMFTEQLLRLAYEMDALMANPAAGAVGRGASRADHAGGSGEG